MNIREIFNTLKSLTKLRMGFSSVVKGNHSYVVLLDTPLHGDAVTDYSKLQIW